LGKKYIDQVWCDVIHMNTCHLLFSHPWQNDKKVQHDDFKNINSFVKDGAKIILGPSKLGLISFWMLCFLTRQPIK
jgi:hypothetical protein